MEFSSSGVPAGSRAAFSSLIFIYSTLIFSFAKFNSFSRFLTLFSSAKYTLRVSFAAPSSGLSSNFI